MKRTLYKEVEIAVSVEEVWKALTDPRGLVYWFPFAARVTPGVWWKPDNLKEIPWSSAENFPWPK